MTLPAVSPARRRGGAERVIMVADNVSLQMSGETATPYHYFKGLLRRGVDVRVVCHARVRDEMRETLPKDQFERFQFVEDEFLVVSLGRAGALFPSRVEDLVFGQALYAISQLRAKALIRRLISRHEVQVVFQPIPITPLGLSFMYDLGVPVVLGPLCGGLDLPPAFQYMESKLVRGTIRGFRRLSNLLNRLIPGKLRAEALIVANQRTARVLPRPFRAKVFEVVESGVDLSRWKPKDYSKIREGEPVRFVFCGRLVDLKGAEFAIRAFARAAPSMNARLDFVGDGMLKESLVALTASLGLEKRVTFHGRLPSDRTIEFLRDSDVYVMPSLRECGGLALLEAMCLGLPAIASDWLAPGEYLNRDCAILVAPSTREGFIAGIADAMRKLASSRELRVAMGQVARRRVHEGLFAWDPKIDRVLEILDDVVRSRK